MPRKKLTPMTARTEKELDELKSECDEYYTYSIYPTLDEVTLIIPNASITISRAIFERWVRYFVTGDLKGEIET